MATDRMAELFGSGGGGKSASGAAARAKDVELGVRQGGQGIQTMFKEINDIKQSIERIEYV